MTNCINAGPAGCALWLGAGGQAGRVGHCAWVVRVVGVLAFPCGGTEGRREGGMAKYAGK